MINTNNFGVYPNIYTLRMSFSNLSLATASNNRERFFITLQEALQYATKAQLAYILAQYIRSQKEASPSSFF